MKKNKLITTLVAVLILLNVGSFLYSQSNAQQVNELRNIVAELPKQPVVYVGRDGTTPKKGIDYTDGKNGADGINAISFSKTIVKEVPTIQKITEVLPSPKLYQQFDPDTGNFIQKYDGDALWSVAIPCSKFVDGCVNNQVGTQPNQPGDLGSQ